MDYTMLVNRENALSSDFVPKNLVIIDENEGNFRGTADPSVKPMCDRFVLEEFMKLQEYARSAGYEFIICSGYRDYRYQQFIYAKNVREEGEEYASKYVALPGTSEHQTGFAIDISAFHNGEYSDDLTEGEIEWLKANAYKFGFILRYPLGKEEITGYNYEPWHYRYVGPLAKELYDNNLTLEEYYLSKDYSGDISRKTM